MPSAASAHVIHLSPPPWWLRLWRAGYDIARPAIAAWRERARFERERRELSAVAELDPRMLRDIGVPDWLQHERQEQRRAAAAARESRHASFWGC